MHRAGEDTSGGVVASFLRRLQLNQVPYLAYRIAPGLGRASVQAWYQHITGFDKQQQMLFMNYGYAGLNGAPLVELEPGDEVNRYCIQLYHHVCAGVDLAGKDVLEVGCGRGGGASYVARYLNPGSVTGLDIAARAVEFCRGHHCTTNIRFHQGAAESLPFPDGSFDAVINVESSHYYDSLPRFLAEVRRVLRPGGYLFFADFRGRQEARMMRPQLERGGFDVVREEDITPNIVQALHLDSGRKLSLINQRVPWLLRLVFREFASTDGTGTWQAFRTRRWVYFSFVLRKSGAARA